MKTENSKKNLFKHVKTKRFSFLHMGVFVALFGFVGASVIFFAHADVTPIYLLSASSLSFNPDNAYVVNNSSVVGGNYLVIKDSATATGSVNLASAGSSIKVLAKGTSCKGRAQMIVKVDDKTLITSKMTRHWTQYSADVALAKGKHSVSITYPNNYYSHRCNRDLYVNTITFYGSITATPTPPPTNPTPPPTTPTPPPTTPTPPSDEQSTLNSIDPTLQPYMYGGQHAGAFNKSIPANTPLDPQSANVISMMVASMGQQRVTLGDTDSVPGIYVAQPNDPIYTVRVTGYNLTLQFRMPTNITSKGSDSPLVVFDKNSPQFGPNTELRLWRASINNANHTATAELYGIFHYDRSSDGLPIAGNGTGYGLSWAGLIRGWEVQKGSINHAVRLVTPNYTSGKFRLPAIKSDQGGSGPIMEGMRLQLDPSVNCNTRTVTGQPTTSQGTRFLRMLCVTLQKYGAIVVDGSGDDNGYQVLLELNTSVGGTANWGSIIGPPPNNYYGNLIRDYHANSTGDGIYRSQTDGIPWDKMRVMATSVY